MKKLSKEEIEEMVKNISEKEFNKELESMPNDLDDLFKEKKGQLFVIGRYVSSCYGL